MFININLNVIVNHVALFSLVILVPVGIKFIKKNIKTKK